jgi:hypothetical protein
MNSMYLFFLAITILAFIFNIILITQNSQSKSEIGVAPIVQLVFIVPILVLSSIIFFFTQNTQIGLNSHGLFLFIPLILEVLYFAFTKDLFSIFSKETGGFLIRSYLYSIGLATIVVVIVHWIFDKI